MSPVPLTTQLPAPPQVPGQSLLVPKGKRTSRPEPIPPCPHFPPDQQQQTHPSSTPGHPRLPGCQDTATTLLTQDLLLQALTPSRPSELLHILQSPRRHLLLRGSSLGLHPKQKHASRADLVCPQDGASLPSSSRPGPPAQRALAEASQQKHQGWQGQPVSCGGRERGTGRGQRLPTGRRQSHTSGQEAARPPSHGPPGALTSQPRGLPSRRRGQPYNPPRAAQTGHVHPQRAAS